MDKMHGELTIPPAVATDPNATELVRVWAAYGEQHATLHAAAGTTGC